MVYLLTVLTKYGKSSQAVGYAAAISAAYPDAVIERLYEVYHTAQREYYCFPLPYSRTEAIKWVVGLVAESQRIGIYIDYGVFPQNGAGCMKYNRICTMYNVCSDANSIHPEWQIKPVTLEGIDIMLDYDGFLKQLSITPLTKL